MVDILILSRYAFHLMILLRQTHTVFVGCLTRYYHNYYVRRADRPDCMRIFYRTLPRYLHVHESVLVSKELCQLFETEMCFAQ